MREIKFREWDPVREKMLGKGMSYSKREEFDDSVNFRFDHEEDLDFSNRLEETDEAGTPLRKLMQYTGLKDRNGTEIYEGDILRIIDDTDDGYLGVVQWFGDDSYPAFDIRNKDIPNNYYYDSNVLSAISNGDFETIEVVGNIYENPELLEVEK